MPGDGKKPPKKGRSKKRRRKCSFCGRADFRKCPCPWDEPFEKWPKDLLVRVRKRVEKARPS